MSRLRQWFKSERNQQLYLLFIMLLHNLIYPLSNGDTWQPILFYAIFSTMFVLAVFLMSANPTHRGIITASGIGVFIAGLANSYAPSDYTLAVLYSVVIVYHAMMMWVLAQCIFLSGRVLLEVVLAAASLYIILGSFYTPIYGFIELLQPNSFVISSGADPDWQHLLYYSYVTLTTVGYGDIIPVKFYAQSVAAFEAVTGVLYTVILLSRLVSLYEHEKPA